MDVANETLDQETTQQALKLKHALTQLAAEKGTKELPPSATLITTTPLLSPLLALLELDKLDDETLLLLCNHAISPDMSFHRCLTFVKASLLPKVAKYVCYHLHY
jgi:hypothetical protein